MSRNPRKPSTTKVKVIDLSPVFAISLKTVQKDEPNVTELFANATFAYVENDHGMYVLDNDGVGDVNPITEENPIEMYVYSKSSKNGSDIEFSISLTPVGSYKFTPTDLEKYAGEEQPLHEFIRSFSSRLESNYEAWDKFFTDLEKIPVAHEVPEIVKQQLERLF